MIVVTGAAGFIASCLVGALNEQEYRDLVLVDDFSRPTMTPNYENKNFLLAIDRKDFFEWLESNGEQVQFIFHLGARTDTTEFNQEIFDELNLNYSKQMWEACVRFHIPLIYASSAATYGGGEHGYKDDHDIVQSLKPLNPYGESKNNFDIWALEQEKKPFFWAGLKFFNVYGPNEFHKGRMASVIFHAFNQIKENNKMTLFRSHNPNFKNGEQLRDFVYVKDVVKVAIFLMETRKQSGLYNLGTGQARTFLDLTRAVFHALNVEENTDFRDTPEDIRDKYQYFTEADMSKLHGVGYQEPFYTLEEGVSDYVTNYLVPHKYY